MPDIILAAPMFGHRYTVIPDSGVVELDCGTCPDSGRWEVGYHPSLDVLIGQARAHDVAEHDNDSGTEPQPAPDLAAAMAVIAEYERLADGLIIPNRAARSDIRRRNGLAP